MHLLDIVDKMYPQLPATKRQDRSDKMRRLHKDLHVAWKALPASSTELSRMVDESSARPISLASERVRGIVGLIAEGVKLGGDYHSIDVPSSDLTFKQSRPVINVHIVRTGVIDDFYPSPQMMSYINQ